MNDLSIIIVNYNVKYFLKQCIQSIYDSETNYTYDIWVVDNASNDNSAEMLQANFPNVHLIGNKENLGFSKANNQAIKVLKSKFTLILNPDTLIKTDTLEHCLKTLEDDNQIGALGVKMYDGNGNYLPESKRGFPTPWASFCKFSGLGSLFSKSKMFNAYYQGHLDKNSDQEIEILTGAFMMMPTRMLQDIGMFDERFFMYGEDIDLSYRITEKGYKIKYLASTSIIHYKGESTPKGESNYVKHFYNAMLLFADKHFGSSKKNGFLFMLKTGVYLSAGLSWIKHVFKNQFRAILDIVLMILSMFGIAKLWAHFHFNNVDYFNNVPLVKHLIFFSLTWILINYIFGHYDKSSSYRRLFASSFIAALVVFLIYGLFPESWRFSRAVILFSLPIGSIILFCTRKIFNKIYTGSSDFVLEKNKKLFIVGSEDSANQVKEIIKSQSPKTEILGLINPILNDNNSSFLADVSELKQAAKIYKPNEIIFCSKELDSDQIFNWITKLGSSISYKIASKENDSILGSDSKNRMGNWYTLDVIYRIVDPTRKRLKRILDLVFSLIIIVMSPLLWLVATRKLNPISDAIRVLFKGFSWVGYDKRDIRLDELVNIKEGIFNANKLFQMEEGTAKEIHQRNLYYAKNYAIWQDIELLFKNIF